MNTMNTNNYIKICGGDINELIFFDGHDAQKAHEAYATALMMKKTHDERIPEQRKGIDEAHLCLWVHASGIPVEIPVVGEVVITELLN